MILFAPNMDILGPVNFGPPDIEPGAEVIKVILPAPVKSGAYHEPVIFGAWIIPLEVGRVIHVNGMIEAGLRFMSSEDVERWLAWSAMAAPDAKAFV